MIEKRVIRHKNRRFESKELPSQTALRLRSDKNKRLVPDEEDNVFAAVSQMCSEPVLARDRDKTQAVVRESLDEKLVESPQLVLRSDRNKALIPDVDDTQVSVAAGEKMLLKALNSPRINWHNELPDEPDMPDSVEEEETVVPSSQIRPQVGRASVDLLESEYAFTQYIKKLIPMAIVGGRLYLFQAPCYRLLSDQEILTEIKAALPRDLRKDISMAFLKRAITQLKTEKDLQIDLEEINYNPYDVIFANGIYNVQTGHMRDGCPMDCYIAANAAKFRPKKGKKIKFNDTERAVVDDFFTQASGGDKEIEHLIWTTLGVMLSTEAKFKAFFYLFGPPDTGKSLFGTLVTRLIGAENCANILLNEVDAKYHGAELRGKLANISLDQPSVVIRNIGVFKQLTSGGSDVVTVEKKFGPVERLESRFIKFLFAGNHLPRLRENDDAFWTRMVLVPFENRVEKEDRDPDLLEKLLDRSDYIILRALKHYKAFLDNNMRFPACRRSEELKNGYIPVSPNEKVRMFVDECCELVPDAQAMTQELYACYCGFCQSNGYSAETIKAFSTILKREVPLDTFRQNSQRGYRGIRIK